MIQGANPVSQSARVGMGRMPRGAFLFARSVRHSHRRSKGGCPICKRRVVSVGRIGSMRLRSGVGEITDLAAAGSRLTRLAPRLERGLDHRYSTWFNMSAGARTP